MEQHKVGTAIVFNDNENLHDVAVDKLYVIAGIDEDGDEYFIDDAGQHNFAAATGNGAGFGIGTYNNLYTIQGD